LKLCVTIEIGGLAGVEANRHAARDESGTLTDLRERRKQRLEPALARHNRRPAPLMR
jgi:hypothetical protein